MDTQHEDEDAANHFEDADPRPSNSTSTENTSKGVAESSIFVYKPFAYSLHGLTDFESDDDTNNTMKKSAFLDRGTLSPSPQAKMGNSDETDETLDDVESGNNMLSSTIQVANEKSAFLDRGSVSPSQKAEIGNWDEADETLHEFESGNNLLGSTIPEANETEDLLSKEKGKHSADPSSSLESGELSDSTLESRLLDSTLESGQLLDSSLESGQVTIKSELEDGEVSGDDEETTVQPVETPTSNVPICRFFLRSTCTWGKNCRFRHPEPMTTGNYQMFEKKELPVLTVPPPTFLGWPAFMPPKLKTFPSKTITERSLERRASSPPQYFDLDADPYYSPEAQETPERTALLPTPTFVPMVMPPRPYRKMDHWQPPNRRRVSWDTSNSLPSMSKAEYSPERNTVLGTFPKYVPREERRNDDVPQRRSRTPTPPRPKRGRLSSSSSSSSCSSLASSDSEVSSLSSSPSRSQLEISKNPIGRKTNKNAPRSKTPGKSTSRKSTPPAPKKKKRSSEATDIAQKKKKRQEYLLLQLLKVEQQIAKRQEQKRLSNNKK